MESVGRDRIVEWATLGVAAGGTGGVLAIMATLGFDSGDVFSLAGALIGAAITVAGALWVTDRGARAAHERETSIIESYCRPLLEKTREVEALWAYGGPWPEPFREGLHELSARAAEVPEVFREAIDRAQTLDLQERVKLRKALEGVTWFNTHYDDWTDPHHEDHPLDERTWPGTLEKMRLRLAGLDGAMRRL